MLYRFQFAIVNVQFAIEIYTNHVQQLNTDVCYDTTTV